MAWSDVISLGFHEEDGVATNGSYGKCNYFVSKKGDLSKQSSCMLVANSMLKARIYRRASWYYLLGGDLDRAFSVAIIGMNKGDYYLVENIAEIYMIRGDMDNAKKYFKIFRENVNMDISWVSEHFDILSRIYIGKFSVKRAKALLGDNMFLLNK